MHMNAVETRRAVDAQRASSHAYRLAREARDAESARARSPAVVALQRAAASEYVAAARARNAATGI